MDENDDEDESLHFDDNPEYAHLPKLDKMRKIRRDILRTINDVRDAHHVPGVYLDVFANKAANEYASWLLQNPENEQKAAEFASDFHVSGKIVPLVGFAMLEEDEDHQGTLQENMMDAHGLLLELVLRLGHRTDLVPACSHRRCRDLRGNLRPMFQKDFPRPWEAGRCCCCLRRPCWGISLSDAQWSHNCGI